MATYFSEKIQNYEGFETFIEETNIEIPYDWLFSITDILNNFIFVVKSELKNLNNTLEIPYELAYDEIDLFNINQFCDGYLCNIVKDFIIKKNERK